MPIASTKRKLEKVKKLASDGRLTIDEICRRVGISKSTVYTYLPSIMKKYRPMRTEQPEWYGEAWSMLLENRLTVREIAVHLNISVSALYKHIPAARQQASLKISQNGNRT